MPSHTVGCALMRLYALDGAPWKWPTWQERTKIYHGLFPGNDKDLPSGWTRQNAQDVQSFFQDYWAQPSEEKKHQYQAKTTHPGKGVWNEFMKRNWKRWNIHDAVVEELKEWDVHPTAILIREHNGEVSQWPHADSYSAIILNSLGYKLFGEEAFIPQSDTLPLSIRRNLSIFVQRSWDSIRKSVNKLKTNAANVEKDARASFAELEMGNLTTKNVGKAIRDVAQWKEVSELYNTTENIKKAEEMMGDLQVIMETLGAEIPKEKRVTRKETCKVSKKALMTLATQEDVSDLLNIYHDYFEANVEDDEEQPLANVVPIDQDFEERDFGMEVEGTMSSEVLAQRLGFRTGIPPQFNTHRHRSGISPWDNPKLFAQDPIPEELSSLNLHWHQLAGCHSIVRCIFIEAKDALHTKGVLVSDQVGLGKTTQTITLITFLNQGIFLQSTNRPLPPILVERPFLAGSTKIPSHPHLVICPGTLVKQWVSELKTTLRPKKVDILVYDSSTDTAVFWGPEGPIVKSLHERHNIIIVASQSVHFILVLKLEYCVDSCFFPQVLANEFRENHAVTPRRTRNSRPWDIPPLKPKVLLSNTLFGQWFLTVTIDEAHHLRNAGSKHTAALRLLQQATVRIIMTATPLHTAPKDISALGRLVGLSHFLDEISYIEEKADNSRMRKAKKLDDDGESLRIERLQIVRRLQMQCKGHLLRRTISSKDFEDKPLIPLPPYVQLLGILDLTQRETEIITDRSDAAKAAIISCSSGQIHTKKFYLEYRTAVGYAKEDPAEPCPTFKTLAEWEPVKSTKMDICARICSHYLTHDDVDDVKFENGQALFTPVIMEPGKEYSRKRRIIIYSEFTSMAPLLRNVLQLYGLKTLSINGKISFEERDKRVKRLYDENDDSRILIFSSVGSAGLNLAVADIVIFFDQPWSSQDECQIIGRAHRQPQRRIVKVIYLLANDSADLLMNAMARNKRDMFDAFVNKELREELQTILQGHVPEPPEADESDETKENGKKKTTKAKKAPKAPRATKRRHRQIVVDDDEPTPSIDTASTSQLPEGGGVGDVPMSDGTYSTDVPPASDPYSTSEHEMDVDYKEESSFIAESEAQLAPADDMDIDIAPQKDDTEALTNPSTVGLGSPGSPTRSPPHKRARKETAEQEKIHASTTANTNVNPALAESAVTASTAAVNPAQSTVEDTIRQLAGTVDPAVLAQVRLLLSGAPSTSHDQTSSTTDAEPLYVDPDTTEWNNTASSTQEEKEPIKPKKPLQNPFARPSQITPRQFLLPPQQAQQQHTISPMTSISSPLTQSSPRSGPSSSQGPSRTPGLLKDVVPPKSALKATRPKPQQRKL
ncbi:hypothetical protein D9756_011032 [Leucocoprinus leucothites]|uniref:P-loop containing nucleoside triphosphate hydrolase protein n=1 Tax=Leucocoprinus leucothites TaxID=201217 RepID=A0A8H5CS01_9AGAR|nr:hypothetical protein D9756_011032 [Leucoagaricus leucothites]